MGIQIVDGVEQVTRGSKEPAMNELQTVTNVYEPDKER